MTHSDDPRYVIIAPRDSAMAQGIADQLASAGWQVGDQPGATLDGVVFDPGLAEPDGDDAPATIADDFLHSVERLRPRLRPRENGGARIVVITTRDGLGWPTRPRTAAAAAALTAAARSLALRLARDGVTVNVLAALPTAADPDAAIPGSHLREPTPLVPHHVETTDVAATARFLIDPRSGYITGQVLYCCGGASLLSTLSV